MRLIDSHCHLNYDYAPKTDADLVREAAEGGVTRLVTIGTDMGSISQIQAISDRYPEVYHTVGVHPHDAITVGDAEIQALEAASRHPKCRAIGEIGLDYHYDHSPREVQRKALEMQLELALSRNLPVVIHSREAEDELFEALERYSKRSNSGIVPGVIHCFSGTQEFGQKCIDIGFYISFSGILTFKKADDLRAAAQAFPLEKILVETDSPYLAPIPHRGKKCEPSMVKLTAQKVAEVKGIPFAEVARVTTANAERFFGLSPLAG